MVKYTGPQEKLLSVAMKRWSFKEGELKFVRGNENWVYEINDYIIRFTGKYHRDICEIRAELDWITYLAEKGLPVSMPIESINGALVEEISDVWLCVVFKKAPGLMLTKSSQFTKELFLSWGKLTGMMHRFTQSFSPKETQRPQWESDDGYLLAQLGLKSTNSSSPMATIYGDLIRQIKSYQKTQNGFGLIHGDFHHGNFHYNQSNHHVTLFDFDDSNYFWYAFDLVVPFASLELSKHLRGLDLNYKDLQSYFMEAYYKEYSLDPFWLKQLPVFTKYRYASLYFWSKGRFMKNRINSDSLTDNFISVCEKLTLEG